MLIMNLYSFLSKISISCVLKSCYVASKTFCVGPKALIAFVQQQYNTLIMTKIPGSVLSVLFYKTDNVAILILLLFCHLSNYLSCIKLFYNSTTILLEH